MNKPISIRMPAIDSLPIRQATVLDAAAAELGALHRRRLRVPAGILCDTEWAILLEAFVADANGCILSTKSVEGAAGVPPTTMLRYLDLLEGKRLISRVSFEGDKRLRIVRITSEGRLIVRKVYASSPELNGGTGV